MEIMNYSAVNKNLLICGKYFGHQSTIPKAFGTLWYQKGFSIYIIL